MKKMRKLVMLAGSLLLVVSLAIGFAVPALAQGVWFSVVTGNVTIDGAPASVDTTIDAYVGAEVAPRSTTTVATPGVYSILIVGGPADAGAVLSFKVSGLDATKTPPAPVFQLQAQVVDLEVSLEVVTWEFPYGDEVFPMYYGSVEVDLDTLAGIPAEVLGVYWLDEVAREWTYFVPGLDPSFYTFHSLVPGEVYLIAVSDTCTWDIPQ